MGDFMDFFNIIILGMVSFIVLFILSKIMGYRAISELYVYERNYLGKRLLVINSFSESTVPFEAPKGFNLEEGKPILCNYANPTVQGNGFKLRPYETRVYVFE